MKQTLSIIESRIFVHYILIKTTKNKKKDNRKITWQQIRNGTKSIVIHIELINGSGHIDFMMRKVHTYIKFNINWY